jgi:hypothetical protein
LIPESWSFTEKVLDENGEAKEELIYVDTESALGRIRAMRDKGYLVNAQFMCN